MSQIKATLPTTPATSPLPQAAPSPSSYWGSVNGARIVSGSLSLPLYGAWVADVELELESAVTSPVTAIVGNLTLRGSVYRQATFAGRTEARLIGGGGGWSKNVQARGYNQLGGVLASQVLNDAAIEVGETVVVATDSTLGDAYARFGGPDGKAARVLRRLAGSQWWVDPSGVTHVGPRPTSAITSDFTVEMFSGAPGTLSIATEDVSSWMPGNTFSSATVAQQTIASVRHEFGPNGVARMKVMVSGSNDRWLEDLRELIRQEVSASLPYAPLYEYQVVVAAGGQVSALPVDSSTGAPPLTGLQVAGGVGTLNANGGKILIGFRDGNPAKPFLAGNEGLFASFVENFLQWVPVPNDGGAALKALLTAWQATNAVTP